MYAPSCLSGVGRLLSRRVVLVAGVCGVALTVFCGMSRVATAADAAAKPFVGNWGLIIPNLHVGWLGIEEKDGQLQGSILWGRGMLLTFDSVTVAGDQLVLKRKIAAGEKCSDGNAPVPLTTTITAKILDDGLRLVVTDAKDDGEITYRAGFSGTRLPPLPPAPDLPKVKFGDPIVLFNGKDLTGWKMLNPQALSGWSVRDGVLGNKAIRKKTGDLRTDQEFEDFNLTAEVRMPPKGNSGIFLRGIYEVQLFDSYGIAPSVNNMGAIFSRIAPAVSADKPANQWQTLDITLVQRHATVILNGQKIIDNQPLVGGTSECLWSDPLRPGPIFLQGDHTDVDFRNIILRPVVK